MLYLRSYLPAALLASLLFTGCASSRTSTTPAASFLAGDTVAVLLSKNSLDAEGLWDVRTATTALTMADRALPGLLAEYAPHFGATVVDATDSLWASPSLRSPLLASLHTSVEGIRVMRRSTRKWEDSGPPDASVRHLDGLTEKDLAEIRERTGHRYLMAVSLARVDPTLGEVALDAFVTVALGLAGRSLLGVSSGRLTVIELFLIDSGSGDIVWYGMHAAEINPEKPEHVSALARAVAVDLFAERYLHPYSFLTPIDQDVVVYLTGGGRISGRGRTIEGLHAVVTTRDGTERIPVETIRSIRAFTGNGQLFPTDR